MIFKRDLAVNNPMLKVFLVLACIVFAGFYLLLGKSLLQPQNHLEVSADDNALLEQGVIDLIGFKSYGGKLYCTYSILGQAMDSDQSRIFYLLATTGEFLVANKVATEKSGSLVPVVLGIRNGRISKAAKPRDGGYYADDVKKLFPPQLHAVALQQIGDDGLRIMELLRIKVAHDLNISTTQVKLASDG